MQPQDGPPVLRAVVVAVGLEKGSGLHWDLTQTHKNLEETKYMLGKSVLHGAFEIQNVSRGFGPIAL